MPASMVSHQQYTMKRDGAENNILRFMDEERKSKEPATCDVVLVTNGIKHYAHKIVLISFSDFFRNYFEEKSVEEFSTSDSNGESEKDSEKCKSDDEIISLKSNETCGSSENVRQCKMKDIESRNVVNLPGINSEELDPILEYMYTSQLDLSEENVNEILLVGCLLQITSVIEFCAEVLLKQPSWRSPLVSPKLRNFVKGRGTATTRTDESVRSSPTAVTWATNGERPVSHETRPSRSRGRPVRSNFGNDAESTFAGQNGQQPPNTTEPKRSRKRRHPNNFTQNDGKEKRTHSCGRGYENTPTHTPTIGEQQQQEYLANIDFAELDRELTRNAQLMSARRFRSSALNLQKYSPKSSSTAVHPSAPPPLVDVRTANIGVESSIVNKHVNNRGLLLPRILPESSTKYFGSGIPGSQYEAEKLISSPRQKYLLDNQPVAMFPQISDCNRSLAAFGFPVFHPGYFGLPFMNSLSRMTFPPNMLGVSAQTRLPEDPTDSVFLRAPYISTPKNKYNGSMSPQSRYAATVASMYAPSALTREYESSHFDQIQSASRETTRQQVSPESPMRLKTGFRGSPVDGGQLTSEIPTRASFQPGLKRFCPDIIQRSEHDDGMADQEPRDLSKKSDATIRGPGGRQFSKRGEATGDLKTTNPKEPCFASDSRDGKPEACRASSTFESQTTLEKNNASERGTHVDHHMRKRKLLRGAQDSSTSDKTKAGEKCNNTSTPANLSNKQCRHPDLETKCSSEDDIITRECHHLDASDLDSDDSGRPSSV